MMKRKWILLPLLAGVLALGACGSSESSENSGSRINVGSSSGEVNFSLYPDSSLTKLGNYKNVEVEAIPVEVTDDDIQYQIQAVLEYCAEPVETDKSVVDDGDVVDISYVGKLDGEAFDGGSADNYYLTIGSGTFIDGFEDGLIGAEVGGEVDLNLTFPDPYPNNTDLAGQDVVFEVTVNSVVEYVEPEWNDEFVSENLGYDTAEEYEEYLRTVMLEDMEESALSEKQYRIFMSIIEDSEFECADSDLGTIRDNLNYEYEYYAEMYGLEMEDFLYYYMGMTRDEFDEQVEEAALLQLESALVIEGIVEEEGLTLSDAEYQEGLEELAAEYGYEADEFEEVYEYDSIAYTILYNKTVDYVMDMAVEI